MAFCTKEQVRDCNQKLADTSDIPDDSLDSRIEEADKTIIIDLSSIVDEDDLIVAGSDSKVLNMLSIWKSVEIILAQYYGTTRKVDEVSDIQYWQKKYDKLLERVISGDIKIVADSEEFSPALIPVITGSSHRLKIYPRKGIDGFTNDGAKDSYKDDEFK